MNPEHRIPSEETAARAAAAPPGPETSEEVVVRTGGSRLGFAAVLLAGLAGMLVVSPSNATMPMQKKAKELGFPADNCQYCHGEKMPKKEAVTYNERGKWLMDQKAAKKATEVDMAWLKDYPGDKK
jgi:hypothetical protein